MNEIPIKRALIAVYDKTGITEFARALVDEFGIEIISTGGTAKHLKAAGIPVTMVEEVTGFPEMLDGRVKTLHPKIHAAILADRDNPDHMRQLEQHGIKPIDMVVVNLYPFEQTVADPNCTFEQAIEMIDIGGPCMLRAAAKNHKHVVVLSLEDQLEKTLRELRRTGGTIPLAGRQKLAHTVFTTTGWYDVGVQQFFGKIVEPDIYAHKDSSADWFNDSFSEMTPPMLTRLAHLRYGENPAQRASAWGNSLSSDELVECNVLVGESGGATPKQALVHGEMSFNNYMDGDSALSLIKELTRAVKEPRALARAALRSPLNDTSHRSAPPSPGFNTPDFNAPAWFLTWTTYGQWLPGDERGFVSRTATETGEHFLRNAPGTESSADEPWLQEAAKERMAGSPVELTAEQAACAYDACLETAQRQGIHLLALAVMANHVHLLCQSDRDGSALLQLFKGNSSHQLSRQFQLTGSPRWWTKSGSKRHVQSGDDPTAAIDYIREQARPLASGSCLGPISAEGDAARAEARGSLSCAVAFIKHTNACGCAIGDDPIDTYRRAYLGDPIAAAGGVLCMNFPVTRDIADTVMNSFGKWGKAAGAAFFKLDVWIAPSFDEDAIPLIVTPNEKRKWGKECRLLAVGPMDGPPNPNELDYKKITGGMLVQTRDLLGLNEDQWKVVTKRAPTEAEMSDLRFAWLVCKHTKSNAITICRDRMLLGNGAGQMSRVKSCDVAIQLARENGHGDRLKGAVAAGDAFFPVPDGPQKLIDAGITAIIHPGGSNRDADTVAACDAANVAMILTGTRHFKH